MEIFTLKVIQEIERYQLEADWNHSIRGTLLLELVAREFGIVGDDFNLLSQAILIHDVGRKQLNLDYSTWIPRDSPVWGEVKKHPIYSAHLLYKMGEKLRREDGYKELVNDKADEELRKMEGIIIKHHEHYDGNGYPYGIKGENIPYFSRVLTFIDSSEAMLHHRAYREKKIYGIEEYIEEIKKFSCRQFDPKLVNIYVNYLSDKDNLKSFRSFFK